MGGRLRTLAPPLSRLQKILPKASAWVRHPGQNANSKRVRAPIVGGGSFATVQPEPTWKFSVFLDIRAIEEFLSDIMLKVEASDDHEVKRSWLLYYSALRPA
jgi:hypothetical protein